jgi:hypothetical protein
VPQPLPALHKAQVPNDAIRAITHPGEPAASEVISDSHRARGCNAGPARQFLTSRQHPPRRELSTGREYRSRGSPSGKAGLPRSLSAVSGLLSASSHSPLLGEYGNGDSTRGVSNDLFSAFNAWVTDSGGTPRRSTTTLPWPTSAISISAAARLTPYSAAINCSRCVTGVMVQSHQANSSLKSLPSTTQP